jgi:beta-lactamase class A
MPLFVLSPEAAQYLAGRPGPYGVAVFVLGEGTYYTAFGDTPLHLASVAKLPIMLALLDLAERDGRALTDYESGLLAAMIVVSDNDAATALWAEIGEREGLADYLASVGVSGADLTYDWGESAASASAVALLLAKLVGGEILTPDSRALARGLLEGVAPDQRWGVTAPARAGRPPDTVTGTKGGWYADDCGWWVNSAGFVLPADGSPAFTVAVLTNCQDSYDAAVETIEGVADLVQQALDRRAEATLAP